VPDAFRRPSITVVPPSRHSPDPWRTPRAGHTSCLGREPPTFRAPLRRLTGTRHRRRGGVRSDGRVATGTARRRTRPPNHVSRLQRPGRATTSLGRSARARDRSDAREVGHQRPSALPGRSVPAAGARPWSFARPTDEPQRAARMADQSCARQIETLRANAESTSSFGMRLVLHSRRSRGATMSRSPGRPRPSRRFRW
jgi:hypothetical protein